MFRLSYALLILTVTLLVSAPAPLPREEETIKPGFYLIRWDTKRGVSRETWEVSLMPNGCYHSRRRTWECEKPLSEVELYGHWTWDERHRCLTVREQWDVGEVWFDERTWEACLDGRLTGTAKGCYGWATVKMERGR